MKNPMQSEGIEVEQIYADTKNTNSLYGDICLVFPAEEGRDAPYFKPDGERILKKLIQIGFKCICYASVTKKEIFVLAKVDESRLQNFAAAIDFRMLLDEKEAESAAKKGYPGIAPLDINEEPEVTLIRPYEFVYGPYSGDPSIQKLFAKPKNSNSGFYTKNILKLTVLMIESGYAKGGAHISIRRSIKEGHMLGIFPLHNEEEQAALAESWVSWSSACSMPWNQPYEKIKEYFGEKIGLYFKFLGIFSLTV